MEKVVYRDKAPDSDMEREISEHESISETYEVVEVLRGSEKDLVMPPNDDQ